MAKKVNNNIEARLNELKEFQESLNKAKVGRDVALENERIALEKAENIKGDYLLEGNLNKYLETCNVVEYHKLRIKNIEASRDEGRLGDEDARRVVALHDGIMSDAIKDVNVAVINALPAITEAVERYERLCEEAHVVAQDIFGGSTYQGEALIPLGLPIKPSWYNNTLELLKSLGMLNK